MKTVNITTLASKVHQKSLLPTRNTWRLALKIVSTAIYDIEEMFFAAYRDIWNMESTNYNDSMPTSKFISAHATATNHWLDVFNIIAYQPIIPWPVSKSVQARRCWELHDFPTVSDLHSHGSWDKTKNPYAFRTCIIPNEVTIRGPGTTWHVASWFLDNNTCLVGNHAISQQVWVLALISQHIRYGICISIWFHLISTWYNGISIRYHGISIWYHDISITKQMACYIHHIFK